MLVALGGANVPETQRPVAATDWTARTGRLSAPAGGIDLGVAIDEAREYRSVEGEGDVSPKPRQARLSYCSPHSECRLRLASTAGDRPPCE